MQITPKILNIPPYISTTWDHIASLKTQVEENSYALFVTLKSGESIKIPGLDQPTINTVFKAHAQHVEHPVEEIPKFPIPFSFSLPLNRTEDGPISTLGNSMRHNPEQAHLPEIPTEVLEKLTIIAKAFGIDDMPTLSPPEENCNCTYCQIIRAFQGGSKNSTREISISEEDLRFRDWEIEQTADKLYLVTNPLDKAEQYNVFLGEPLGCTCGNKNCEHIKAVLHS